MMASGHPLDQGVQQMTTSMAPAQLGLVSDHHHQSSYAMPSQQPYHPPSSQYVAAGFQPPPHQQQHHLQLSPTSSRKRRLSDELNPHALALPIPQSSGASSIYSKPHDVELIRGYDLESTVAQQQAQHSQQQQQQQQQQLRVPPIDHSAQGPPNKKSRVNTPWTPAEEQRLKQLRDQGQSWGEISKSFPTRTEGSVKKHWYKDMHYAEFAQNESTALLHAIREYEQSKWKVIGQKVGKPAKACEQYARENFTKEQITGKAKAELITGKEPGGGGEG